MFGTKSVKYFAQKILGLFLGSPVFRNGSVVGFSLVKSERVNVLAGKNTRIVPPFFLHNVSLDNYSYIAQNSNLSNVTIGKFCSIGPNCCCGMGLHPTNGISTSPMFYSVAKQNGITLVEKNKFEETKQTLVGNDVFIGANVTILDGVKIFDGAVIGAGAVVISDIPPYAIAVGVPAKVVKYRFDKSTIECLLHRQWWNDENSYHDIVTYFYDVNRFLEKEK